MEKLRHSQVVFLGVTGLGSPRPCGTTLPEPPPLNLKAISSKLVRYAGGRNRSMPDIAIGRRAAGRSLSLPYRDNPDYRDSHTQISPVQAPDLETSPDFSTFTFTGNMVWVWSLASWVRGAQKGLASQVKGRSRRRPSKISFVRGKSSALSSVGLHLPPPPPAPLAPLWWGPIGSRLFPLVSITVDLVP